ncbi:uncharacterized protein AB9X84_011921 [Acanthopagrus schlegelii]
MKFCFATFAACLFLFGAAFCVPSGRHQQDSCADVKTSSLALNRIAKIVSTEARNGSTDDSNFSGLAWVEATDMCDPESLNQKSAPCLQKILSVLTHFISIVEDLSVLPSCAKFASDVKPEMHKLHQDISKCVLSRSGTAQHAEDVSTVTETWMRDTLCTSYTFDRLFSFSILTARVFALGDPTRHTDGSAQKCL